LLKFNYFLFVFSLSINLFGQESYTVLGSIYDDQGNKLPFATVYEESTTNGTTSNAEGNYQLRLSSGAHDISVQYVGYTKQTRSINIVANQGLDFRLSSQSLLLQEVIVSSNSKNPAYRIVREAIKKKKYYEKEFNAYSCEVYIKGLQRLDKKPSSFLGITVPVDTGIIYLSESISQVKFEQPDKFYEELIASKTSGKSNGFSYNRASEMMINLYQNSFFIDGLSERSFISPIANNAFLAYDYELDGVFFEDSVRINKIKIIPRRKTDPTFSGYMYIIEDSWRLHSVEVKLLKANGIDFVDSLRINQIFSPAQFGIWMPITQNVSYTFQAFGFKGSGQFIGNYSNYVIEPNYKLREKLSEKEKKTETPLPKVDLFTKQDFGNAVMKVEESSNKKEDIFWKQIRPVPLSAIEIKDYRIKDSIQVIAESKPFKDSIDEIRNKFRLTNLLVGGYNYYNTFDNLRINFPTAFDLLQYNTVEGFAPELNFNIRKSEDRVPLWELKPSIKYGFGNEQLQAKISGFKTLDYKSWEFLYGGFGRYTMQFDGREPISPIINSFTTLFQGENYLKLYQNNYAFFGYQKEIFENIRLNAKVELSSRNSIQNVTTYSFNRNPSFSDNLDEYDFGSNNRISTLNIQMTFRPGQKYIDRPKTKFYLGTKYPEFKINYKKGLPIFGQNNFDQVAVSANYTFRIGLIGESSIIIESGGFLNQKRLTFIEYKHFNGNQTYARNGTIPSSFQLLPYYQFSTSSAYVQANYEHHFNEFIFNKIPLVKRLNLQGVLSVNFLSTQHLKSYTEVGFGIEHIFKFLRIDYYSSFNEGTFLNQGITFGLGF
jgi:hypothetical protein